MSRCLLLVIPNGSSQYFLFCQVFRQFFHVKYILLKIFLQNVSNFIGQKTADMVTFTEEILHGKLHFLCSDKKQQVLNKNVHGPKPAQKIKFSMKDFFSKCDQICRKLRIWSHLLKKSLMEKFIFCAVKECLHGIYEMRKFMASTNFYLIL